MNIKEQKAEIMSHFLTSNGGNLEEGLNKASEFANAILSSCGLTDSSKLWHKMSEVPEERGLAIVTDDGGGRRAQKNFIGNFESGRWSHYPSGIKFINPIRWAYIRTPDGDTI